MIIHSDTATDQKIPFGQMNIKFYVEDCHTDEDCEVASQKLDNLCDEIEELIRCFIKMPNEFRLVTDR